MGEDAYVRAAQSVVRIIGAALIMGAVFLFMADLYLYFSHKPISSMGAFIFKTLLLVAGAALVMRSRAIAERITRDL